MEKNRIRPVKAGKGMRMSYSRQKEVLEDVYKRQIPSVAVKCVDIRRNTSGEGGLLDDY